MTPKEKAWEIFNAMHKIYDMSNYPNFTIDENDNQKNSELWENNNELFSKIYKQFAKESALITVDEIIKVLNPENFGLEIDTAIDMISYYKDVKKEIELL